MSLSDVSQRRIRSLVEPVVSAEGFEVDSLTVTAAGRRSILRLTVDADDGVDLDSVARVSRAVSEVLDEAAGAAFSGRTHSRCPRRAWTVPSLTNAIGAGPPAVWSPSPSTASRSPRG